MKKVIALVAILALSLSFASCTITKTKGNNNTPSSNITVSSEISSETKTENEVSSVVEVNPEVSSKEEVKDTSSKTESKAPTTTSKEEKPAQTTSKVENSKPQTEDKTPTTDKNEATSSKPSTTTTNVFFNDTNNAYDINALSIKPRYVYWKDGDLYAECFVINGFSHNVFNIDVKSITLSNASGVIAQGEGFGVLSNVTLAPRTYIVWGFKFSGADIKNSGADLSSLLCNARVSNNY